MITNDSQYVHGDSINPDFEELHFHIFKTRTFQHDHSDDFNEVPHRIEFGYFLSPSRHAFYRGKQATHQDEKSP
jgi:hypothetical protein